MVLHDHLPPKEAKLLGGKIDSRSGTGNETKEHRLSCHKRQQDGYQDYMGQQERLEEARTGQRLDKFQ